MSVPRAFLFFVFLITNIPSRLAVGNKTGQLLGVRMQDFRKPSVTHRKHNLNTTRLIHRGLRELTPCSSKDKHNGGASVLAWLCLGDSSVAQWPHVWLAVTSVHSFNNSHIIQSSQWMPIKSVFHSTVTSIL